MYEYAADLRRVVDGDTLYLTVDMGFTVRQDIEVRLSGLDCPDSDRPEEKKAATAFTTAWFSDHAGPYNVITTKGTGRNADRKEKWGRYLASVTAPDGANLNLELISTGHAVAYHGGTRG
jgi:micrococcal nuclease